MPMTEVPCGECGAVNRADAKTCRLCGALMKPELAQRPRMQRKLLRRTDFVAAAAQNRKRTTQLVTILLLIGAMLGYLLGWNFQLFAGYAPPDGDPVWFVSGWGVRGAIIVFVVSALWTWFSLRNADRLVMYLTGAHETTAEDTPQLHNVVEEMAIAAGVPKPRVFVIETPALNAFATGMEPRRAAVAVTRGLLDTLSRDELQGVIGHEMGHVVNWDIRYATAVAVLVGVIALVSDAALRYLRLGAHGGRATRRSGRAGGGGGAAIAVLLLVMFVILAPLFAKLVQMAISRQREFLADATSVRLTRNPHGLISALEKLERSAMPFDGVNRATQHLFIVNPLRSFGERASALLATHPPIERRIERLRNLGAD